jgi:hypothetical protein
MGDKIICGVKFDWKTLSLCIKVAGFMSSQTLLSEIESAPEEIRREVWDFLKFLKSRQSAGPEREDSVLPLAQTAWGPDWTSAEEDEAWKDL